jgi:hypothetical protein
MTEIADTAEDLDTVKFKALLRSLSFFSAWGKMVRGNRTSRRQE